MRVELIDTLGSWGPTRSTWSFAKQSDYEVKEAGWEEGDIEEMDRLRDKDRRLISYLAKHGHWTPFAHCFLQFRIEGTNLCCKATCEASGWSATCVERGVTKVRR